MLLLLFSAHPSSRGSVGATFVVLNSVGASVIP